MEVGFAVLILVVLSILKPWRRTVLVKEEVKIGME
jgi:hypothetical protein